MFERRGPILVVVNALACSALSFLLLSSPVSAGDSARSLAEGRLDWYARTGVFEIAPREVRSIQALEQRLLRDPRNPILLDRLANRRLVIALKTREHEDAESAENLYRRLVEEQSNSTRAWIGLGRALHEQHRFEEALTAGRRAVELDPSGTSGLEMIRDVHFAVGHYAEAQILTSVFAKERSLPTLARQAQMLDVRGASIEARSLYRQAIEIGEVEGANAESLAQVYALIGESAREHMLLAEALDAFDAALRHAPNSSVAQVGRAEVLAASGRSSEAIEILERLTKRNPHPTHWIALAKVLEGAGHSLKAEPWWNLAQNDIESDIAKGDRGHLRDYARLLIHRGQAEAAVAPALRDLAEVRRDLGAFETAARALHHAGRSYEALVTLRGALRIGSDRPELHQLAAEIQKVLDSKRSVEDFYSRATRGTAEAGRPAAQAALSAPARSRMTTRFSSM